MTTIDLSSLPNKSALTGSEQVLLNDDSVAKDVTVAVIAGYTRDAMADDLAPIATLQSDMTAAQGDIDALQLSVAAVGADAEAAQATADAAVPSVDLSASSGASLVGYMPAGAGAVATDVQKKLGGIVSVDDFGAVGDGVTDDTLPIKAAISSLGSSGGAVNLTNGATYRTTSPIDINTKISLVGNGAVIAPDASVIEAIRVGYSALCDRPSMSNLVVDRGSYSGATENIGVALYNVVSGSFVDVESRYSKYNIVIKPGSGQRVGYSNFQNIRCIAGNVNLLLSTSGTGWANENTFSSGRLLSSANTVTQLRLETSGSQKPNGNRFFGVSAEGTGDQSIYCAGDGNLFSTVRTEGTWAVNDAVVTGDFNFFVSCRNDFTYTDSGFNNQFLTNLGNVLSTSTNDKTTLTLKRSGANTGSNPALRISDTYSSSGNSYGVEIVSGRDTASGYIINALRISDGLQRFYVTSNGLGMFSSGAMFSSTSTALKGHLSASATLTYTAISAGSSQEQTLSVPGVTTADTAFASPRSSLVSGLVWSARVTGADTVAVRIANVTAGSITPAAVVWSVDVNKH